MRKNEAKWFDSANRWQIKVQKDGVRRTFFSSIKGTKGKIAAEKQADSWLESGIENENVKCGELLDAYLEHVRKGTGTSSIKQHENFIKNYIRPAIGNRKIKSLTLNHLQAIIDDAYAEKHLAKKTLQDLRGCISGFLRFCRLGKYTTLVSMDLQIPRSAKRPHKNILGAQELQNLFILENTVLNGKSQPDWCIHAYRFSVLNGLRPGELIGLRWEDIQGNILHIDRSVNHYKEVTEGKMKIRSAKSSCRVLPWRSWKRSGSSFGKPASFRHGCFQTSTAHALRRAHSANAGTAIVRSTTFKISRSTSSATRS